MKIIAVYGSRREDGSTGKNILVWPDSALIRTGKPLFLPDETTYVAMSGVAAKIKAVGKSIRAKFAPRYYDELAPLCFLTTKEVAEKISAGEHPYAYETVADYSLVEGDSFSPARKKEWEKIEFSFGVSSLAEPDQHTGISLTLSFDELKNNIDNALAEASRKNTLKTGDLAAFLFPDYLPMAPERLLTVAIDGKNLIQNKLK